MTWIRVLAFLGMVGLLSGCASLFNQPANVEATRMEVEELRKSEAEMRRLSEELNERIKEQNNLIAQLRADHNASMEALENRLVAVHTQLEDQSQMLELLRRQGGSAAASGVRGPVPTVRDSSEVLGQNFGKPPLAADPAAVYDAAYRDFSRGDYQLAAQGFEDFVTQFPRSDLADDAQYWLGECYYAVDELDQAVNEFLKVRDRYPEADKVPRATLKTGYAFLRKGDSATARRYFQALVREFPRSNEADLAREKLQSLQ